MTLPIVGTSYGPAWSRHYGATITAGANGSLYERRTGQTSAGTLTDGTLTWHALTAITSIEYSTARVFSLRKNAGGSGFSDVYAVDTVESVFVVVGNDYILLRFNEKTTIAANAVTWSLDVADPRHTLLLGISTSDEFDIIESGTDVIGPKYAW